MQILSLCWFTLFAVISFRWYRQDGLKFPFDFNRIAILIWSVGMGMYDLALSTLLHPNLAINAVGIAIVAIFFAFANCNKPDLKILESSFDRLVLPKSATYWIALLVLALSCIIAFRVNVNAGTLRGLSSNPGMDVHFRLGYLYRLSAPLAIAAYIAARLSRQLIVTSALLLLFLGFVYITLTDLTRGPVVWILTGILVFELFNFNRKRPDAKISLRMLVLIGMLLFIVIVSFDKLGAARTASRFSNVSEYYDMKVDLPSGLTWIYIYLTSPIENARYAIDNIGNVTLTWGAYLIYPVLKGALNVVGLDSEFVHWLDSSTSVQPYLNGIAGLNVGSFIMDAIQDFSYFGIVIYSLAFGVVSVVLKRILKSERLSTYTKLIVYPLIVQEALWSIFDNMVISGPLWVCAILFMMADLIGSQKPGSADSRPNPRMRSNDSIVRA